MLEDSPSTSWNPIALNDIYLLMTPKCTYLIQVSYQNSIFVCIPAYSISLWYHIVQNQTLNILSQTCSYYNEKFSVNGTSIVPDTQVKYLDFSLTSLFHVTCSIHHQILFIIPSKYIQNPVIDISLSTPLSPQSFCLSHVDYCYSLLNCVHPASIFSCYLLFFYF